MSTTYMSLATPRPSGGYGSLYKNPGLSASHSRLLQHAPFTEDPLKSKSHHGTTGYDSVNSLTEMVRKSVSSSGIAALLANSRVTAIAEKPEVTKNATFTQQRSRRRERRLGNSGSTAMQEGLSIGLRLSGGLASQSRSASKNRKKTTSRRRSKPAPEEATKGSPDKVKDARRRTSASVPRRRVSHQTATKNRFSNSLTAKTIRKSKSFGDAELEREKKAYLLKAINATPISKGTLSTESKTPTLKRIPRRQISLNSKLPPLLSPLNQSIASMSINGITDSVRKTGKPKVMRKSKSLGTSEADRERRLNMKKVATKSQGSRPKSPVLANAKCMRKSKSLGNSEVDQEKRVAIKKVAAQTTSYPIPEKSVRRSRLNRSLRRNHSDGSLDFSDLDGTGEAPQRYSDKAFRNKRLYSSHKRNHSDGSLDFSDLESNGASQRRHSDKTVRKCRLNRSLKRNHSDGSLNFSEIEDLDESKNLKKKACQRGGTSSSYRGHFSARSQRLADFESGGSSHSSRKARPKVSLKSYLDHHTRPSVPAAAAIDLIATVEASHKLLDPPTKQLRVPKAGLDGQSKHRTSRNGKTKNNYSDVDTDKAEKGNPSPTNKSLDLRSHHGPSRRTGRRNSLRNRNTMRSQHLEQSINFQQEQQEAAHHEERKIRRRASLGHAMGVLAAAAPQPLEDSNRKPKLLEFSTQDALKLRALKALAVTKVIPPPEAKPLSDSSHSASSCIGVGPNHCDLAAAKRRILELGESYRMIHDEQHSANSQQAALAKEVPMLMGSYVTASEPSDSSTIESQPSLQLMELASSFSDLFG